MWASAYTSARALASQMTLAEKVNITRGYNVSTENACHGRTGSVPRLGWPGLCLQDAGNGVRGTDLTNSYPSGIHVGAAWDKNLTYRRGFEMGNEFRIKGGELSLNRSHHSWLLICGLGYSQYCSGPRGRTTGQNCIGWTKLGRLHGRPISVRCSHRRNHQRHARCWCHGQPQGE